MGQSHSASINESSDAESLDKAILAHSETHTPPVLANYTVLNYKAGQAATAIDTVITVTDTAHSTLASATIAITNFVPGQDVLGFEANSMITGNITGSFNTATGILTLYSSGATATVAQFQTALREVTYRNSSTAPTTTNRYVAYSVSDGTVTSNVITSGVTFVIPPVLANYAVLNYKAGQAATAIDTVITVTDTAHSTLASATIAITNFVPGQDVLGFEANSTRTGNITGSFNTATGILTLYSSGATATVAQFQTALREVTYRNSSTAPTTTNRYVAYSVSDGTVTSNVITSGVTFVIPPVLANYAVLNYKAGQAATAIDTVIAVTDTAHSTLASATIAITNFVPGQDVLGFEANSTKTGNITGSFNTTTGILTLYSSGATATVAQFQTALREVTYRNSSTAPTTTTRYVNYSVSDGTVTSNVITSGVKFVIPPVLANYAVLNYKAGQAATAIDTVIAVTDTAHSTLASATIAITNFVPGQDVLGFEANSTRTGNITGSFNTTTGILTLYSSGATATVAQFQTALREVTYRNSSIAPTTTTRYVNYSVSDGTVTSNVITSGVKFVTSA